MHHLYSQEAYFNVYKDAFLNNVAVMKASTFLIIIPCGLQYYLKLQFFA